MPIPAGGPGSSPAVDPGSLRTQPTGVDHADMLLYAAGRETVVWCFWSPDTITSVDVRFDGAWHAATVVDSTASLLLAGPLATSNPSGTLVLAVGHHDTLVRLNDSPELIVRPGGRITVR